MRKIIMATQTRARFAGVLQHGATTREPVTITLREKRYQLAPLTSQERVETMSASWNARSERSHGSTGTPTTRRRA